jgi:hypothetical protein
MRSDTGLLPSSQIERAGFGRCAGWHGNAGDAGSSNHSTPR